MVRHRSCSTTRTAAATVNSVYSKYVQPRITKAPTETGVIRKVSKNAVKDLERGDIMIVVDRDMVTMKDPLSKALQRPGEYNRSGSAGDDVREERAEAAIRASFEVWYHEKTIIDLASRVQAVMDELSRGLSDLRADTGESCQSFYDDLIRMD